MFLLYQSYIINRMLALHCENHQLKAQQKSVNRHFQVMYSMLVMHTQSLEYIVAPHTMHWVYSKVAGRILEAQEELHPT